MTTEKGEMTLQKTKFNMKEGFSGNQLYGEGAPVCYIILRVNPLSTFQKEYGEDIHAW